MSTLDPPTSGRVYVYLALVVAATWLLDLPAVLASTGLLPGKTEDYLGFVGLGALAPAVLALVFQKREGKRLRELLGPTRAVRRARLLFLVAPLVSGFALTLGLGLVHAVGFEVGRFIAAAVFPVFEEIGWRGYALPRLLPRLGRWRASLVLGGVWALWHVMMTLTTSAPLGVYTVVSLPFFVAGSYVFSWFYERTGGSLLIAILLHLGAHLDTQTWRCRTRSPSTRTRSASCFWRSPWAPTKLAPRWPRVGRRPRDSRLRHRDPAQRRATCSGSIAEAGR